MSVIQSQCAVVCSTLPLHSKFFYNRSVKRYAHAAGCAREGEIGAPKGIIKCRLEQLFWKRQSPDTIFEADHIKKLHCLPNLARRALYYALGC
jgi:hypothetical protein